ncbi:MAG: dihydroorotase, partial [Actinobacteria bacterium]|nr:dihydroorotase [Actinomycetota bacterium]
LLADHVGARLHICHLSTAGSVEIVRWAKSRDIKVTAEVTPHHLILTDELVTSYNPVFKVNPPLRTQADVEAVREGLADGTIDIVATDHAPHPSQDKDCEWVAAAFGMTGLETALQVVHTTMVKTGLIDWQQVANRMSIAPANIGRVTTQGQPIAVGAPANITLFNPNIEVVITAEQSVSASRNTPFAGMKLAGSVQATFFNGRPTVLDGKLV